MKAFDILNKWAGWVKTELQSSRIFRREFRNNYKVTPQNMKVTECSLQFTAFHHYASPGIAKQFIDQLCAKADNFNHCHPISNPVFDRYPFTFFKLVH